MNTARKIQVYADGAKMHDILRLYREGFVRGFTTNPTLMAKAGIHDYAGFARELLTVVKDRPVSFEVFSDEFAEMERQAHLIHGWGRELGAQVNVKIPITNTRRESALGLVRRLLDDGIPINLTAIFTQNQLDQLRAVLKPADDIIISIFAGRIADTGVDPMPLMKRAVDEFRSFRDAKVLWASPREVLNVYQAELCGCHIITATEDLIAKLKFEGKDLGEFSLETVKMFHTDAQTAGFSL